MYRSIIQYDVPVSVRLLCGQVQHGLSAAPGLLRGSVIPGDGGLDINSTSRLSVIWRMLVVLCA